MIARVNKTDFGREKKRLDKFFRSVYQGSFIAAKESADEYVKTVKSGIGVTHSPGFAPHWEPLSPMWMAMKKDRKDKFWAETFGIYRAVGTKIMNKTTKRIHVFGGIQTTSGGRRLKSNLRFKQVVPKAIKKAY